ncbi:DDE_3 domain-containing protein [Trichonephila clavipes]|uniref:DDE_3 domain-containing protein n=1 Tax=Trichonephila clavipes TaxID=2585209 RepID=A0A8X6T572_TRICX|nr:DDE_3 domain-containing protein [Trichonephila clavipes]
MGAELLFMDDNARPHRANIVDECLQLEDITRMDWTAYSLDLNLMEHVRDMLGRRIATRQPPPTCLPEHRWALLDEWCSRYKCPKCGKNMVLRERKETIDGYEWRCRTKGGENSHDEGYQHLRVNHSLTFKDPETGAHTNSIEGTWSAIKRTLRNHAAHVEGEFDHYLAEYMWRRRRGYSLDDDVFREFLRAITTLYPPMEKDVPSRTSVQHVFNWTSIGDQTSLDILNLLDQISSNPHVHFQWLPSYVEIKRDSSEKITCLQSARQAVFSGAYCRCYRRWFAVKGIRYKGILARSPRCSRRRRIDEADNNTPAAVDLHAAKYLEEAVRSFSAL